MRTFRLLCALLTLVAATGWTSASGAAFTSTTSSASGTVTAGDWTPPTVELDVPAGILSATEDLQATAADTETPQVTVRIEIKRSSAATWTLVCADAPSPLTCPWDTRSVPNGEYNIRAVARDAADNPAEQAATRTVFNVL